MRGGGLYKIAAILTNLIRFKTNLIEFLYEHTTDPRIKCSVPILICVAIITRRQRHRLHEDIDISRFLQKPNHFPKLKFVTFCIFELSFCSEPFQPRVKNMSMCELEDKIQNIFPLLFFSTPCRHFFIA